MRILEWVAFSVSRGSSPPRGGTRVSHIAVDSLPSEPPPKPALKAKEKLILEAHWGSAQKTTFTDSTLILSHVYCLLHAFMKHLPGIYYILK